MQRMTPPRGMVPLGPQVFSTDGLSLNDRPLFSLYSLSLHSMKKPRTCFHNLFLKQTSCFTKKHLF